MLREFITVVDGGIRAGQFYLADFRIAGPAIGMLNSIARYQLGQLRRNVGTFHRALRADHSRAGESTAGDASSNPSRVGGVRLTARCGNERF